MTPKEFAAMCRTVMQLHEGSWDITRSKYAHTIRECAEATNKEWATVVICLLVAGYSDIWEWCDEVEAV